jgi:hypothetical protein
MCTATTKPLHQEERYCSVTASVGPMCAGHVASRRHAPYRGCWVNVTAAQPVGTSPTRPISLWNVVYSGWKTRQASAKSSTHGPCSRKALDAHVVISTAAVERDNALTRGNRPPCGPTLMPCMFVHMLGKLADGACDSRGQCRPEEHGPGHKPHASDVLAGPHHTHDAPDAEHPLADQQTHLPLYRQRLVLHERRWLCISCLGDIASHRSVQRFSNAQLTSIASIITLCIGMCCV